jgi:hypothetical protein
MTMKISAEDYEFLLYEDEIEGFSIIEHGEWVVDHKYEHKRVIVQHIESSKYYALYSSRSGSYYTEYYYDELEPDSEGMVELEEVVPVTKTIVEYV